MPCGKYRGRQRRLCFATKEWKDWSKIKFKGGKRKMPKCRVKGYLKKVPGRKAKVRVRGHLMKYKSKR
jgi:hypothetical protein